MRRLLKTHPPSSGSPVVRVRITVGRLFASLLSWRDSGTHPPAWQDLFLKPQTVIGAWITALCVSRAMWVEMDSDEGGGGGGGGGTGDERKLITWHKPAHPSLTHLSVRSRDGGEGGRGWRRWRRRTYRVSWLDSWLTKEGRVRGGTHTGRCTHVGTHKAVQHNYKLRCTWRPRRLQYPQFTWLLMQQSLFGSHFLHATFRIFWRVKQHFLIRSSDLEQSLTSAGGVSAYAHSFWLFCQVWSVYISVLTRRTTAKLSTKFKMSTRSCCFCVPNLKRGGESGNLGGAREPFLPHPWLMVSWVVEHV